MLTIRRTNEPDLLQMEIDRVIKQFTKLEPGSKEYIEKTDQYVRLSEIKAKNAKKTISPDTWAIIVANLLGIVLVLHYERADIVTSKAIGFVAKLK